MHYTLHQLQIFAKVAETGNITKAAEILHLTQPAVSIQLKKLQDQFELPLIEQIRKQLYVTDFGKEILVLAKDIQEKIESINYRTNEYKGGVSGRLKLAIVSTGKYVMPYFLDEFLRINPNVELSIDVTNKSGVINDIESNSVDIALVSVLPKKLNVNELIILENKLFLIGNMERKFSKEPYSKDIFKELPLIYREDGSATRAVMESFFDKKNVRTIKKMELTSNEAVKQAVIAGLGYSIMPLIGLKNEIQNKELQIVPIKGMPVKSSWRLIWLNDKKLPSAAGAFIDFIKIEKQNIFEKHFKWTKQWNK